MEKTTKQFKRLIFTDPITKKNVTVKINKDLLKNCKSYPVPFTYLYDDHAIILYIDANCDIRTVESSLFFENKAQKPTKIDVSTLKIIESEISEEIPNQNIDQNACEDAVSEVIEDISPTDIIKSIDEKLQEPDIEGKLNILITGSAGVGKTSLIYRYLYDFFKPSYIISQDVKKFSYNVETLVGTSTNVLFWDIPGQINPELIKGHFKDIIDGIICLFDITNKKSFQDLKEKWIPLLKEEFKGNQIIYLANKIDESNDRLIFKDDISQIENSEDLLLFETSVKTNFNVKECIDDLILSMFLKS